MKALIKKYNNIKSPFHYSNYNFITINSIDIKDTYIQQAENILERAKNHFKINNVIHDFDLAIKIELSVFEYALIYCLNNHYDIKFLKPIYDDKIYNIILNLEPNNYLNNTTFIDNLLNKKINPQDVAFMSPSQIHPQNWEKWIKKKEYRELRENNIEYTDAYQCSKCKEKKCKVRQIQTRSADEGATIFITCMNCRYTYSIYS
jgi:DNA-directed RNA polymerase subunit M/transcription elongation factor TFIIS